MSKKESFHKILFWTVLSLNIIVALVLLLAFLAGHVQPSTSGLTVFCGITFFYWLFANLGFVLLWLFLDYRFCLISISIILLNINTIDKHFQFREKEVPETCLNPVKVMSYNCNLFGIYKDNDLHKRRQELMQIINQIRATQPDILCFQEYFWDLGESLNFHTTDEIASNLGLDENKEHVFQYFIDTTKNKTCYGLAIFSKYKIVNSGVVFRDQTANAIVFVDIKFREDTVRVYNAHLASIQMNATDYGVSRQITANGVQDPDFDKNAKKLYRKVADAASARQVQAQALSKHIEECRYPVIVCGDFNDTPAGYCYNHVAGNLHDTFRESGKGKGATYHGDALPACRIDYILSSPFYLSYGYTVHDDLDVSDHYPIHATISLRKKK